MVGGLYQYLAPADAARWCAEDEAHLKVWLDLSPVEQAMMWRSRERSLRKEPTTRAQSVPASQLARINAQAQRDVACLHATIEDVIPVFEALPPRHASVCSRQTASPVGGELD